MFIKNFEKISKQFSVSINDWVFFWLANNIKWINVFRSPWKSKLSHVFRRCTSEFKWIHFNSFNPLTTPPPSSLLGGGDWTCYQIQIFKKGGGLDRASVFRGGWLYSARRGCKLSTKNKLKLEYFMTKKVYKQELFVLS